MQIEEGSQDPKWLLSSPKPAASLMNTSFGEQIEVRVVQTPDVTEFMAFPTS